MASHSPKQKLATFSTPRPLTPSELEWLRREGSEFSAQFAQIRAAIDDGEKADLAIADQQRR